MLFHGSALAGTYSAKAVAIPLYRFFDRMAETRFSSRDAVVDMFKFSSETDVYLSGVAQDREVERWWALGTSGRAKVAANLRRLGVAMVTTPNFSLMVDRPRWDDLHSMRRILLSYHELISEGQPTALHVNGRSSQDFVRWADYIQSHDEVTHLAYEFTTGTRSPVRMLQHADWLIGLSGSISRRLGLIMRGGSPVIPLLSQYYDVTYIDCSPFEKAQHRQVMSLANNGQRRWQKQLTETGEPVDKLLEHNIHLSERWLDDLIPKQKIAA